MPSIVEQDYWDRNYAEEPLTDEAPCEFTDLFDRYLPQGGTCFEVGCYPGRFLAYLGRRFGYTVSGLDLTPYVRSRLPDHLRRCGVRIGTLQQGDFLGFRTDQRFDVVCSFGFLEHFTEYRQVIQQHVNLLKTGGILVLSSPNFRGLQFLLHYLLDRRNLRRHVVEAMDLENWAAVLDGAGMQRLFHGYYHTFDFWTGPDSRMKGLGRRLSRATRPLNRCLNYPNRFTSPYLVSISRRA